MDPNKRRDRTFEKQVAKAIGTMLAMIAVGALMAWALFRWVQP